MIVLDTCAVVFDALDPRRLGTGASKAIREGERKGSLAISGITLWEISMLIAKGRLDPGLDTLPFLNVVIEARSLKVLPVTPEIAALSASHDGFTNQDPADRLIAATTMIHRGLLVTCDALLRSVRGLKTVW